MVEKIKINVIDLDKTLISYDSFRVLVMREIKTGRTYVIWITFLRIVRLLPSGKYKEKVAKYLQKTHNKTYFENFAATLYNNIDKEVLQLIDNYTETGTINILLSASPNFFVKYLIERLAWRGSGSFIDKENTFVHLYRKEKINWLAHHYTSDRYDYNFAISDSSTDDELLSLFQESIKWIKS